MQALAVLMMGTGSALAQTVDLHWTSPVQEQHVTFYAEPQGKPPEEMAVLVESDAPEVELRKRQQEWETEASTNRDFMRTKPFPFMSTEGQLDFKKAVWVPFKTNLLVDFGPEDGGRWLWVSFRNKNGNNLHWDSHHIVVQTKPSKITITSPKEIVTSQPMIQLQGLIFPDLQFGQIHYQVFNQEGVSTAQGEASIHDRQTATSNDPFTCYDIELSSGTNTIILSGTDDAGFSFATNFVCVFTIVGDTNPPGFSVTYPQDGMSISGSQFDLYGRCDDTPTAVVTALLCNDEGKSAHLNNGFVERNGCLWVERVPVAEGKNYLTIVATDAANNSSLTNLMFTKSGMTLYMNPVADPNQLWQPRITIMGFCSDTNRTVTVSGVKAKMKPDGHWTATNVPVNSPNGGGTATFDISAGDDNENSSQTNSWLPTICGQPVENNALSAGLSLKAVSTNEYNHYSISLGLTNTSGHNIPNTWMLPKGDARFSIHLYDLINQEVVKQEWIEKSGQTLATNLNIHHLGKDQLTNLDSIISFQTNSTARIASLNLDEHFRLPLPGDYRLEVALRMFKIATDGQLIPVEFPPISTTIKIIDQSSEMVFYLNNLQRQNKLIWGAERDGLRIGVAHGMKWTRINDANQIEIFLQNTSTNDYRSWNLRFPNPKEQFDVTLYDSSGKEVPKTALGEQQGQPLSLDGQDPRKTTGIMDQFFGNNNQGGRRLRPIFVSAKDATECARFNLNDYFEIKTPGKYRLTYQQRFYRWNTNSILNGVILPTVTVPLDINYVPGQ